MYDTELIYKFNPSYIDQEDIPRLKLFIVYLTSLIELYEKENEKKEEEKEEKNKLKPRIKRINKIKKNEVLKIAPDGVLEPVEE